MSIFSKCLIRTSFLGCEYRRMLTCVSSKTRSHDVVGASGEAKMESSQGEAEGNLQGGGRAVCRKRDRIEGIWVHGSSRLVSDLQKSGRNGLRILRVDIKPLIRHRKLRERVVYESIGSRGKSSGLGRGSGLLFPKAKMFEDFFMTSSSSMTLMIFMTPEHLGHVSGSTFPDQVRDRVSIAFSLPG